MRLLHAFSEHHVIQPSRTRGGVIHANHELFIVREQHQSSALAIELVDGSDFFFARFAHQFQYSTARSGIAWGSPKTLGFVQ